MYSVCKEKLKSYNLRKHKFVCLVHSSIGQLIFSPVNSYQGQIKDKIVVINFITHNGSSGMLEEMRTLSQHFGSRRAGSREG